MTQETEDTSGVQRVAASELREIVERVERLEKEKSEVGSMIGEVYAEAKGKGYDVKAIKKVVWLRNRDGAREKREEEESNLDLYMDVLGMS